MGYDISLIDKNGESVQVDRFSEGGTQPVGGSTTADISITYNYSKFFYDIIDEEQGIRWIYGRHAGDCIGKLIGAIHILGIYKDEDYWKATPGNAGHILRTLVKWAGKNKNAVFRGD